MKLRHILRENIQPPDFFDLYALITAYQEDRLRGEIDPELARRLRYELNYVLDDHLTQMFAIVADRFLLDQTTQGGDTANLHLYQQLEIPLTQDAHADGLTIIDKQHVAAVPPAQRIQLIRHLIAGPDLSGNFAGTTWKRLGKVYLELMTAPRDIESMIRSIDRFYGLTHHAGLLADYMDEEAWLEQALNIRSIASPAEILQRASSDVRALAGSAAYGVSGREITPLQRVAVVLRKRAPWLRFQYDTPTDTIGIEPKGKKYRARLASVGPGFLLTVGRYKYRQAKDRDSAIADWVVEQLEQHGIEAEPDQAPPPAPDTGKRAQILAIPDPTKRAALIRAEITSKQAGPWPEAEPLIAASSNLSFYYARDVVGGRWPPGEPVLLANIEADFNGFAPPLASQYAAQVLQQPWPELQQRIAALANPQLTEVNDALMARTKLAIQKRRG